jgi:hypothetical protein
MFEMKTDEFFSEPAKYLVCRAATSGNDVSLVVVEDDPGPYMDFLQDVVEQGLCSLALTVPFSHEAIRLLLGEKVSLGEDDTAVEVCLPNPTHCVAILDVRNTAGQTFPGYDPSRPELAGYQFFKQLRGFPGKPFFATRYGTEHVQAQGSGYGVIPLEKEPDDHGPLMEADLLKLRAALDNAMVQVDVSEINRMVHRGSTIEITFHGQVCTPPAKREVLAFMALVQSGPDGLTAQKLADAVGYKPRAPKPVVQGEKEDIAEDIAEVTPEALLAKLLDAIAKGAVDGVSAGDVSSIPAGEEGGASSEDQLRKALAVCVEKSPGFSYADCLALLSSGANETPQESLDRTDKESMSFFSERPNAEILTPGERRRCRVNYLELNYRIIPELQAEEARLQAEIYSAMADGYSGVVASTDAHRGQEARERKKAVGVTDDQKARLQELKDRIKELGSLRDDYFRMGVKSVPQKNEDGETVGYRVAAPTPPVDDAMRKLKGHMLKTLRNQCSPSPKDLIAHVDACWIRDSGSYRYTGKEMWTVVQP